MLVHHRGGNGEMQRWRSTVVQWLWVELCFDRWGVINNSQLRAAREQTKVAWMLCRRRMMQKLDGIAFYDSIHIVDAQLAFVDQESICWRFAFEKRDCSFDSPNSADKRSDPQRDDTEMCDEKREMMFAPGPTRERGTGKVCSEQNKPKIEPRRSVNVGARNLRIETRLIECPRYRGDDDHRQQDDREFKRCEELEDRIALPSGLLSRTSVWHLWIDTFSEVTRRFNGRISSNGSRIISDARNTWRADRLSSNWEWATACRTEWFRRDKCGLGSVVYSQARIIEPAHPFGQSRKRWRHRQRASR